MNIRPPDAEPGLDRTDPRFARLKEIIGERSLMRGAFTLASGRSSTYLFQLRQTTMDPEGSCLLSEIVATFMRTAGLSHIGGLEMGAVPIVSAVAATSFRLGHPVSAFFVRKKPKDHGARQQIDGYVPKGGEALIVDDVTTTGGSTLKAVEAVRDQCTVRTALSIVDREEGATENLAAAGIRLLPLFRRSDFGIA